jgi:hypothetical protein
MGSLLRLDEGLICFRFPDSLVTDPTGYTASNGFTAVVMSGCLAMARVFLTCLLAVAAVTPYLPAVTKQRILLLVLHFWFAV